MPYLRSVPILSILHRPFPAQRSTRKAIAAAIVFGAFVGTFLFIFRPFGLHALGRDLPDAIGSYAAITTGVMLFMQLVWPRLWPKFYEEERWTVGRETAHTLGNILLIAAGNLAYTAGKGYMELSITNFFLFLAFTLVVGSFPVVVGVLLRQNAYQRHYLAQSRVYNTQLDRQQAMVHAGSVELVAAPASAKTAETEVLLTLQEEAGGKAFNCLASSLLAIEAADNYVKLHLDREGSDEEGRPFRKTELLRLTMAAAEEALSAQPGFFRSHRSWLVNLGRLEKVEGNARGYQLHLRGMKERVPVSRSRIEAFQGLMDVSP